MASIYGPSSDVQEFGEVLKSSKRVLALCGAGLSAASGLDTFRGAGGMWRNHQVGVLRTQIPLFQMCYEFIFTLWTYL